MFKREGIYKYRKIFPEVYQIRNCQVNMYLIKGEEKCLLFDTGYGFGDLKSLAEKLAGKPVEVVLSHGHYDHIGSADQFERVYLHERDLGTAHRHSGRDFRKEALKKAAEVSRIPFERVLPEDFEEEKFLNRGEAHYLPLREGDVFDLGGIHLEVVELPGHTRGSIALYWREKKVIFVSDAVNGYLYLFLPESASLSEYRHTLRKLKGYDFQYMIQGYSCGVFPRRVLDDYIDTAEHPDWKHGKIRPNTLSSGKEALVKIVMSERHPKLSARMAIAESKLNGKE